MNSDATSQEDQTLDQEGSDDSSTLDESASTETELVASYRKRQAGAEAARQEAANQAKTANDRAEKLAKELADLKAGQMSAEASELATLTERLAAAEARATAAERNAEDKILDAKFPNARKELPEVTDEVKLARFEAMLREDEVDETPTTRGNNGSRQNGTGDNAAKPQTIKDVARDLAQQVEQAGLFRR